MRRRQYISAIPVVAVGALAGCSGGSDPEYDGTTSEAAQHNVEVSSGETIRVEAENDEGARTTVTVLNPDGDMVLQEQTETEATITHTVESDGVYRVLINPTGTSSYEIYVDA
jgi:plastocyanin